jgi:hypothetical protein
VCRDAVCPDHSVFDVIPRLPEEKANPYNWQKSYKWLFTLVAAIVTLCVAFASSCYTGATAALVAKFDVSREIIVLGVTLFVLGVSKPQCSVITVANLAS